MKINSIRAIAVDGPVRSDVAIISAAGYHRDSSITSWLQLRAMRATRDSAKQPFRRSGAEKRSRAL